MKFNLLKFSTFRCYDLDYDLKIVSRLKGHLKTTIFQCLKCVGLIRGFKDISYNADWKDIPLIKIAAWTTENKTQPDITVYTIKKHQLCKRILMEMPNLTVHNNSTRKNVKDNKNLLEINTIILSLHHNSNYNWNDQLRSWTRSLNILNYKFSDLVCGNETLMMKFQNN